MMSSRDDILVAEGNIVSSMLSRQGCHMYGAVADDDTLQQAPGTKALAGKGR